MKKFALVSMTALAALVSAAGADVLWDQSDYNVAQAAFVDQEFGDFPDFSTYLVNDVAFGSGVNVTDVTTYFTSNFSGLWGSITSARLNIYDHAPTAADNPSTGTSVGVSITDNGDGSLSAHASGLNINLAAGTYWVGLTPIGDFGVVGQEFHLASFTSTGADSLARNPGGGFGIGTDWVNAGVTFGGLTPWDGAILIGGTVVPAPGALALLGLGGLVGTRRRRA